MNNSITEAQIIPNKNKIDMKPSHKIIGILASLIALFSFYAFAISSQSNAKAQELASWTVQEITAETQAQKWLANKSDAAKNILRLKNEIAKESQGQGLTVATR